MEFVDFWLTMVFGGFGIMALFISGYWGVIEKQVMPCMFFALIGLVLLVLGFNTSPFKDKEDK